MTSTSEAPTITQASIRKLVADSVTAALEAQAATMANASNPTRNLRPTRTPVVKLVISKESQHVNISYLIVRKEKFVDLRLRWSLLEAYASTSHLETIGHLTKNCQNKKPATGSNQLPVTIICHAYGEKGHYTNQCRKTNINAQGRAYMLRDKNAHQDPNVVTGTFLLNQHLAKVLFDFGADRSFISISLASMLNILPMAVDTFYEIEMADGNLVSTNTVIKGCTLTFIMTKFTCDEKVVHIPINGETLNAFGGDSTTVITSTNILLSFIKSLKGSIVPEVDKFFHDSSTEKKSDEKRLEDIPGSSRIFRCVFSEDLPGLLPRSPSRVSKLLNPRSRPCISNTYRLAPSEMQASSNQL
ncbi:hypothetical protein Tco_1030725 [Tanacetum coccineum]|uniref:Reverse transcriptase domain-containing protein n=1 Tax=Tanacetum coccineum TaxID=301880 RepID=A0ABQ5G770_9ASTR